MKENVLYIECTSGISGDMTVAALLDLGADRQVLMNALNSLPLTGYSIEIKDVFKSGIRACDFNVILQHDNHDHDMEYLHGSNTHVHSHDNAVQNAAMLDVHHTSDILTHDAHAHDDHMHGSHVHDDHTHTSHAHDNHTHGSHVHDDHTHTHHHDARNLQDVIQILSAGDLTPQALALAIRIFEILAKAEAYVHGKTIDEVHFHEVGAVDSIVDIAAVAVCIDNLHPTKVVFSPLTDGTGQIRCQHGLIPVPVPAVAAIAVQQNLILKSSSIEGELVTPTGAAIAAAAATDTVLPDEYRIRKIGFGAGKRNYQTTGLLRAMLLESTAKEIQDTILTMETNIDDCSGEALSCAMQKLMEAGALDVFYTPIFMKKNRPAYLLKVICTPENRTTMESIIFRNTTTIGIRYQEMQRTKLDRRIIAVETPWGMADIKCCTYADEIYYYPENDSVYHLSDANQIGFPEMYHLIQAYAQNMKL